MEHIAYAIYNTINISCDETHTRTHAHAHVHAYARTHACTPLDSDR